LKTTQVTIRLDGNVLQSLDCIARDTEEKRATLIKLLLNESVMQLYTRGLALLMKSYREETGRDPLEDQDGFTSFKNGIEQNRCPSGFFAEMVKDGYMAKITTRIK
jgi:hypothetical protein